MHSRQDADKYFASSLTYIDGVPVKIGEKFKPPRKVALPLNFHQSDRSDILNQDYNFSLEKRVLEWSENYRRKKDEKARAKVEKVAHQIEQFTRHAGPSSEGCSVSSDDSPSGCSTLPSSSGESTNEVLPENCGNDVANEQTQPAINSAILANLDANDILKPVLSSNVSVTGEFKSSGLEGQMASNIKLEDFEAESSPFDSVELKTINDIEELKSVLQGVTCSNDAMKSATFPSGVTNAENGMQHFSSRSAATNNVYYYPNSAGQVNGIVPNYSGFSSSFKTPDTHQHHQETFNNTTNFGLWAAPSNPNNPPIYSQANTRTDHLGLSSRVSDFGYSNSAHIASEAHALQYPGMATTPGSDSSSSSGSLRNARSTPDLLKELGKSRKEDKHPAKGHPPRPSSVGPVEDSIGYWMYEQKKELFNSAIDTSCDLSKDERTLIGQMAAMGFPQDRALRAVKKLGVDDKKVVEHLCAVQTLVERGFKADHCEMALFLHEQDEVLAKDYLQLMKQFLDLGFEEDAIKRALYLNKNDRDKALDYLVS